MSEKSVQPRHYTDAEVALILREAALLQEQIGGSRPAAGLTLAQLQEIAAEAGINPHHVAEVASRLPQLSDSWARVLRAPTRFRYTHEIQGEVLESTWGELIEQIRASLRTAGRTVVLSHELDWRSNDEPDPPVGIRVRTGAGRTLIEVDANVRGDAFAMLLLPGVFVGSLGFFGGALQGLSDPAVFGLAAAGAGAGLGVGLAGWRVRSRQWQQRLTGLVGQLSREVMARQSRPETLGKPDVAEEHGSGLTSG